MAKMGRGTVGKRGMGKGAKSHVVTSSKAPVKIKSTSGKGY